jgi:hypothetical protein
VLEPVLPLVEKTKDPAKTPRIAKKSRSAMEMLQAVNKQEEKTIPFHKEEKKYAIRKRFIQGGLIPLPDIPEG